jgi:cytoskeletal protein CcmA (bactofilin family)
MRVIPHPCLFRCRLQFQKYPTQGRVAKIEQRRPSKDSPELIKPQCLIDALLVTHFWMVGAPEVIIRGEVIGTLKSCERVHIWSTGKLRGDI